MPPAQQAIGRQGDPGPSSLVARSPYSSWELASPHGKAARSVVRLASTELKPSGSGPAPDSLSRSAAAMARAACFFLAAQESTHASTRSSRMSPARISSGNRPSQSSTVRDPPLFRYLPQDASTSPAAAAYSPASIA